MKRVFALVLLVSGLVFAGMVSANMTRSDTTKEEKLWSNPNVRASVVYRLGDTVRIYIPEGNNVLCKGDSIPIYRSSGNTLFEPSSSSKMDYPAWITGNVTTPPDLMDKKLIGEVKVFKLVGEKYAYGKLIVGDASQGDLAAKPSHSCLAS